jgi:hypothetical protein
MTMTTINEIDKNIGCKLRRHQMRMTVYDGLEIFAVNPTNDGDCGVVVIT